MAILLTAQEKKLLVDLSSQEPVTYDSAVLQERGCSVYKVSNEALNALERTRLDWEKIEAKHLGVNVNEAGEGYSYIVMTGQEKAKLAGIITQSTVVPEYRPDHPCISSLPVAANGGGKTVIAH